jgi:hypothetical protein
VTQCVTKFLSNRRTTHLTGSDAARFALFSAAPRRLVGLQRPHLADASAHRGGNGKELNNSVVSPTWHWSHVAIADNRKTGNNNMIAIPRFCERKLPAAVPESNSNSPGRWQGQVNTVMAPMT